MLNIFESTIVRAKVLGLVNDFIEQTLENTIESANVYLESLKKQEITLEDCDMTQGTACNYYREVETEKVLLEVQEMLKELLERK